MSVPVPEILDQIALSGGAGWPVRHDAETARNLELCRQWGFHIRIENDRAYLQPDDDSLVPAWILAEMPVGRWNDLRVVGFFEVGSTNEEALSRASAGAPAGIVIYAESQTAGHGRKGRRWNSPPQAGLYFSIVVRSAQPQNRWPLVSHAASVALVDVLKELEAESGKPLNVDLKWPNDVLLSQKKVAGILLETAHSGGGDFAAVVGVGINVKADCVPEELRQSATSIEEEAGVAVPRRRLLVRYLDHFQRVLDLFERGEHSRILERWKNSSSMWDGVSVRIIEGNTTRLGVTCGLTEIGALRIRMAEGVEETVLAGDVSVRRNEA